MNLINTKSLIQTRQKFQKTNGWQIRVE